jgi:hypothetical protein
MMDDRVAGITRREQHDEIGAQLPRFLRKLTPVQSPRQSDIGE